jgi:hypothetical protein
MILHAIRLFAVAVALLPGVYGTPPVLAQGDELQEANQLFKQGQLDRALERVNAHLAKPAPVAAPEIIFTDRIAQRRSRYSRADPGILSCPSQYRLCRALRFAGAYDKVWHAGDGDTHASQRHPMRAPGYIYAKMASQAYDKAPQLDKSNTTLQRS